MTTYYLDTSPLIKRYVIEAGSNWVRKILLDKKHLLLTSRLTIVEVYSATARRYREESVTLSDYNIIVQAFTAHSATAYQFIELTIDVINIAQNLLEKHPLRANDAVQLASAIVANNQLISGRLNALILLSADNRLNEAASLEGLRVENPNHYTS